MKKGFSRLLCCALLALSLLCVTAFADSGPKPQLIVRVEHAPQEFYYLDLLAEGEFDDSEGYDGLTWSYSEEETAALDKELLSALRAAVPEGWHACTAQGSTGAPMWGDLTGEGRDGSGNPLHTFGYVGLPESYRILIVTQSGETWVSEVLHRAVLQSSVTIDWKGGAAGETAVSVPSTAWGYALQFFATLVPTLLIEGALLLAFGFSWRENRKTFLLTNLATQGALALWLSISSIQNGLNPWWYLFFFLPAELAILVTETLIYRTKLTGKSKARAALYGVAANLASAGAGVLIAGPVWRFIVSRS